MIFLGQVKRKMVKETTQNIVGERITKEGRGSFFFCQDFSDVGTPEAVKKALQRLKTSGLLMRIAPGIYYYPKIDTELGLGTLWPSMLDIAYAIARRDRATIAPTGVYALNMLGLSTQVPANAVFYTTGSSRRVPIGKGRGILFIHTSSTKKLAYKSRLMMLIVSAMCEIGKDGINDTHLKILKQYLDNVEKEEYNHDIQLAPIWVRKILNEL